MNKNIGKYARVILAFSSFVVDARKTADVTNILHITPNEKPSINDNDILVLDIFNTLSANIVDIGL